jgi:hypothetical protein
MTEVGWINRLPYGVVSTSPLSVQCGPAASRSVAWATLQ